jgi:hypothetical protein
VEERVAIGAARARSNGVREPYDLAVNQEAKCPTT